jgi:hypothetical protein
MTLDLLGWQKARLLDCEGEYFTDYGRTQGISAARWWWKGGLHFGLIHKRKKVRPRLITSSCSKLKALTLRRSAIYGMRGAPQRFVGSLQACKAHQH